MSGFDRVDEETMQAIEPRAGEELERTLARYARIRLEKHAFRLLTLTPIWWLGRTCRRIHAESGCIAT